MTEDKNTIDNKFTELLKIAVNVNTYTLVCHNSKCSCNFMNNTTVWNRDNTTEWLLHLFCNVCHEKWSVCSKCPKFKVRMTTTKQITMHRNRYHSIQEQKKKLRPKETIIERKRNIDSVTNFGK
jgi:hypothetical protein